jgi:hypothetical protein
MQWNEAEVKSKSAVVGIAKFQKFDSIGEAITELGEETVLGLVNTQHATNAKNAIRAAATGTPPKAKLRARALASMTMEEFQSVMGDEAKLEALIARKMAEYEAEIKATLPVVSDEDAEDAASA